MNKETFRLLKNTINTTQYMTKNRTEKFMKLNDYDEEEDINNILELALKDNDDDIILKLQEYEYDKNYRYFTLYTYDDENMLDTISTLKNDSKLINTKELDHIDTRSNKPSIKFYDDEEVIDIKFSMKLKSNNNSAYIKYIVICSIFLTEKLMAIKFYSVSEEFYQEELYIKVNNSVKAWIESNLKVRLNEFDSTKTFKDLYKNIKSNSPQYKDVSIHSVSMDDELNGRTYFRATDTEMLPFIGQLTRLTDSFESKNDKNKVLEYIKKYEDEAILRSMALKWKKQFKNNKKSKLGSITVGISSAYSVNNVDNKYKFEFILHHIKQDESINRERINYAIKYISKHFQQLSRKADKC